jgi:hypothetical protein
MHSDVWEIVKKQDGTFDIFRTGELLHASIPEKWLASKLGQYGFCGQEHKEIVRQLDQVGRAKLIV